MSRRPVVCDSCGRGRNILDVVPVGVMIHGVLDLQAHLCLRCADDVRQAVKQTIQQREQVKV